MRRQDEEDLIRFLHGELPSWRAEEFRVRMRSDPELARAHARMRRLWDELETLEDGAGPSPVPDLRLALLERLERERQTGSELRWSEAPAWARAAAAAALLLGILLGITLGHGSAPVSSSVERDAGPTLAEGYWSLFQEEELTAEDGRL